MKGFIHLHFPHFWQHVDKAELHDFWKHPRMKAFEREIHLRVKGFAIKSSLSQEDLDYEVVYSDAALT